MVKSILMDNQSESKYGKDESKDRRDRETERQINRRDRETKRQKDIAHIVGGISDEDLVASVFWDVDNRQTLRDSIMEEKRKVLGIRLV